jgi:hypothetical protein
MDNNQFKKIELARKIDNYFKIGNLWEEFINKINLEIKELFISLRR